MFFALRLMCLPLVCIQRSCGTAGATQTLVSLSGRLAHVAAVATVCLSGAVVSSAARGQAIVYQSLSPVVTYAAPMAAGYPGGYMANYSPAGNYAAVTAFSPPVATGYVASYPVTQVASYAVEPAVPVTSFYSPPAVATPVTAAPLIAAPAYVTPVTTYYAPSYAPAAVAVPVYRRGLFGGLRPARTAMYIPY